MSREKCNKIFCSIIQKNKNKNKIVKVHLFHGIEFLGVVRLVFLKVVNIEEIKAKIQR